MPLRPVAPVTQDDEPTAPQAGFSAVDLLREDDADDELNSWALEAADRVLDRVRKAHGLQRPAERSGFFTTKGG